MTARGLEASAAPASTAGHPTDTEEGLHFAPSPIPEAKAFDWSQLHRPTQRGLHELFSWLEAACQSSTEAKKSGDEHLSTSLLSAVQALREPESFLVSVSRWRRPEGRAPRGARPRLSQSLPGTSM